MSRVPESFRRPIPVGWAGDSETGADGSHPVRGKAASSLRRFPLDALVLAVILLLALGRLPEPFFGDQGLNMLMGNVIAQGGAPYVDLWDLKHPGVFFFFAAGGSLFGFHEVGIHLFELVWMLVLALVVRVTAGHLVRSRLVATFAPLFVVGTYYALTTGYHLTQTEALLGLPLLLSLASAAAGVRAGARRPQLWLFASGLSAGVLLVFKAPYVLIPGLFWLFAVMEWRRVHGERLIAGIRIIAPPVLAGALIPAVATLAYLAQKQALGAAWWTFVVHPGEEARHGGVNPQRLVDSLVWFGRTFKVLLALALLGAWDRLWRGWDLLTMGLVTWVVAGLAVIIMQVISWWPYHFLVLLVPVGLLAVRGGETLWLMARAAGSPRLLRAIAAVSLILLGALFLRQVEPVPRHVAAVLRAQPLPIDSASMQAYQATRNPAYAAALETTSFLRDPESHPGPIYVFGNPNLYHVAGRPPAIPLLTWGTSPPVGTWNRLVMQLEEAAPAYIYVDDHTLETMVTFIPPVATEEQLAALRSWLEQHYQELRKDSSGTWYLRSDLADSGEA